MQANKAKMTSDHHLLILWVAQGRDKIAQQYKRPMFLFAGKYIRGFFFKIEIDALRYNENDTNVFA